MIYSWRITFCGEDRSTGGAERAETVLRAPTAADALAMFEANTKASPPRSRYFRGVESIELVEDDRADRGPC